MPGDWIARAASAPEVVSHVHSDMTVFVHGAGATPLPLVAALAARQDAAGEGRAADRRRPPRLPRRAAPLGGRGEALPTVTGGG
jgi:hypothetical protein